MSYWLLKTEPSDFSWENLKQKPDGREIWDGVRNYQARKYLREMQAGDRAFFYHSKGRPQQIVGIVEIVRAAFPDPTQFEPGHPRQDPKSNPADPRWSAVEVKRVRDIHPPIGREELKRIPELCGMVLLNNTRLSVQPVSGKEWEIILELRA